MIRPVVFCTLVVSSLALGACAPPGQGASGFRDIDWPRADHALSASESREVEVLLARLGYKPGAADGQITTTTRQAIRLYQRDIGAPITGFISTPLLQSLRINAPQTATTTYVKPATKAPKAKKPVTKAKASTPAPRKPAATQTRSPAPVDPSPTEGGDAGAGGSGGSGWN